MKTVQDLHSMLAEEIYFVPNYRYRRIRVAMYVIARNMIYKGEY